MEGQTINMTDEKYSKLCDLMYQDDASQSCASSLTILEKEIGNTIEYKHSLSEKRFNGVKISFIVIQLNRAVVKLSPKMKKILEVA